MSSAHTQWRERARVWIPGKRDHCTYCTYLSSGRGKGIVFVSDRKLSPECGKVYCHLLADIDCLACHIAGNGEPGKSHRRVPSAMVRPCIHTT